MRAFAAVILARTDSARLPGKALCPVGPRRLVDLVVERLLGRVDGHVVLATTDCGVDDALVEHVGPWSIALHRGDASDVARRLLEAATGVGAEYVARVNGDSPFVDPALIRSAMDLLGTPKPPDLISTVPGRTFPYGVSVEIMNCRTLATALPAFDTADHEHVTRHFYDRPGDYDIRVLTSPRPDLAGTRMAVDDHADLERLRLVAEILGDRIVTATWSEAAELYRSLEEAAP